MTAMTDERLLDALSRQQRDRLAVLLDEYLVSLERGIPLPLDELASQHPELAGPLRAYAESLRFLCLATEPLDSGRAARRESDAGERRLGDYRIVREIGRGGMGVVYEAEQLSLGRRVALKVLPFAAVMDQKQLARFANEARAAALLNHPHIVPVYGVGEERGVHYYSMQLISGQPLDRVIGELQHWQARLGDTRSGAGAATVGDPAAAPSPAPSALLGGHAWGSRGYFAAVVRLGIEAAEALHHAHQMGIVHRDIKPSNLLLDGNGKLWITDFGLARLPTDANLTVSGNVLGTARYMSPEQASGKAPIVDQRADIYSLGITLYELLTLQPAFDSLTPQQFLRQIAEQDPPPPRQVNPALPADLEPIILKAIEKQRESRYQSADELAEDFRRFLDGRPTLARRPTLWDRCNKWTHRHANFAAAAAAVLLVALAATIVTSGLVARAQRRTVAALQTAERQLDRAETNYRQSRQVLDRYGLRLAEELADVPGLEPLRHDLLEDTLQHYQALLRQTQGDAELQAEQALTRFKIAEIAAQLGDPQTAESQYAAAGELFLNLAEADGQVQSCSHRSQAGLCYNNLGRVLAAGPALARAEVAYQRAAQILSALCREEPTEPDHRWRLALVHANQGLLHAQREQTAQAEACYAQAIRLLRPLVVGEPDRGEFCKDLAVVYNNRGALYQSGAPARAAEDNARAIELLELLAAAHPQRLGYQRELALCLSNRGALLSEIGPPGEALAELRRAIGLQEQLVRRAPAMVGFRRDLAVSCNNLGRVLLDGGQAEEADAALDRAQGVLEALAADYPDAIEHWIRLGGVLNNRAALQERQGQTERAAALYEQALQRLEQAVSAFADSAEAQGFLERTRGNYQRLIEALGRDEPARRTAADQRRAASPAASPLHPAAPPAALPPSNIAQSFAQ